MHVDTIGTSVRTVLADGLTVGGRDALALPSDAVDSFGRFSTHPGRDVAFRLLRE